MNFKYRPEIDGLRAIAVLGVIFFHADIYLGSSLFFKGGFFGVDLFFVISGFLITGLIIAELDQTNHFSFLNFYERRIRRILPMLFSVTLVSIPVALNTLSTLQLADFSKSIFASLLFYSNFYWHHAFQIQEAEAANIRPFVHTWSLSIEEQFYLCFPFVLFIIHRWAKSYRGLILSLLTLLSLGLAQWITLSDASLSFHTLSSRFWEFTLGAILAHALNHAPPRKDSLLFRTLPSFGLFFILYSLVFIPFRFGQHPGYITLIPVMGTVFIIGFAHKKDPITQILSHPSITRIGLISYSLYLWHHPIFAFGFLTRAHPSLLDISIWLLLSVLLSILSYHYIERPFRSPKSIPRKSLFLTLAAASSLIAIVAFTHL